MKYIKKMAVAMGLKIVYDQLQDLYLTVRGFHLLSREQTFAFLALYEVKVISENLISLPQVANRGDNEKIIFPFKESISNRLCVWKYQNPKQYVQLSKYGSVVIKRNVLCTDWTHTSFYKDIWKRDNRYSVTVPSVIAPFSHLQDGIWYGGYFDFVFHVLAKICRIKDTLSKEDFENTYMSYPLFNAPYEKDYLNLLGFNLDNLIDSRECKVISPRAIIGNKGNWYPNKADILSLKTHIERKFKPAKTASNRIYIRRSNRRCIVNEYELITALKKFNFIVIEDKDRTIMEQMSIYHNASFILGPHGASFSNIIWCDPGTHLFELFSRNYMPDFFLYLTTVMDMKYSAYYEESTEINNNYSDAVTEDIYVSVPKLELCLKKVFTNELC
jgi:hypothetical protein